MLSRQLAAYAAASAGGGWSPLALGASLLAWWDAEATSSLTLASGAVTTWADVVGGLAPTQSVTGQKPAYSATSFNNRPGVTFASASSQFLVLASTTGLPTGATAGEMWMLFDQTVAAADTTARIAFAVGTNSAGQGRSLQRIVTTGVNRARAGSGDNASNVTASMTTVDLSGRHVIRGIFTGAAVQIEADSTGNVSAAVTTNTATTRTTIGANASAAGATFFDGVINSILVTSSLSAAQATLLYTYLNARKA